MGPSTTQEIDPLDWFNSKMERRAKKEDGPKEKLYPGSTPPRNEGVKSLDSGTDLWLNDLPSKVYLINGTPTKFYPIGALATALGKSTVTLRGWESKGWLPAASFRTPAPRGPQVPGKATKGKRLYTQGQLVFLTEAFNKYILSPRNPNWDGFRKYIKTNYPS